ncbi:hypothetical protein PAXRUDRAFT_17089 [Paxillus rubicundulus Ve08.2h10]|uniref:Uncharacterized protein n=1 Tax=Paxillus rubicundulus Ve08.2h10 TaxID=930991 RepID=A0A0D0DIW3_9AGAM|nr:hypothetical protein PAXRUDRAFT_17089 [Paxillus rubicundulus Ve08.2h10]
MLSTKNGAPTTRALTQNTPLHVTPKNDIINQKSEVTNHTNGANFLERQLLCITGKDFTTDSITTILLHITQIPKLPLTAKEAIRTVAFILDHASSSKIADDIQNKLQASLVDSVSKHVTSALSPHIAQLLRTTEDFKNKLATIEKLRKDIEVKEVITQGILGASLECMEEAADGVLNNLEDVKNIIDTLTPSLESTQTKVNALHHLLLSTSSPSPFASQTLRAPPVQHFPPAHSYTCSAICSHQVLFNPSPGQSLYTAESSPTIVTDKLKAAVETLRREDSPPIDIKRVLRLNNGGLLIELDNEEAATWLKSKPIHNKLTDTLGIQVIIRDQTYQILLPFLPITTRINAPSTLCNIETENGLACGTITQAKWVKPPEKRAADQRVAHAILMLSNPMSANMLIRDGLYHRQDKLYPKKNKKEAI